jgi:extradiol dioxygenase family protein
MTERKPETLLDSVHHVAVAVQDVKAAVEWYRKHFQCKVSYQDDSWAMLDFANLKVALVIPSQHPPHLAFVHPEAEKFGALNAHRDGTRSVYLTDPAGNAVEVLAQD